MPDFSTILESSAVGIETGRITGSTPEGLKAGAYSAWINSITGSPVNVITLPDSRARLVLDKKQVEVMKGWLNNQITRMGTSPKGKVEYDLGAVVKPVALRYALPLGLGLFFAGIAAGYILTR